MATYLVTGVAGFIASRVTEMLLDEEHTVVGIDNLNHAYDVRMKEYRLERLKNRERFSFYEQDISDKHILEMKHFIEPKFDAVINLAARAGVRASVEDPWVYVDTNMTGTLNLLELCQRNDIPKFILASTSSIYGNNAPLPTPEAADSARPLQAYAASKKGAEAMAHAYHYLYDIDVSVVRYFTVYGPAGRPDMVMFRFNKWIKEGVTLRLNGNGEQSRGFTFVDDIARGTIAALKPVGYEIINLGGHEVVTINELIAILERLIGRKAEVEHYPFHKADAMANQANIEKARNLLGWEPQVSLEEGIRLMVAWYEENREWVKNIDTSK
ncbi:MAG: nucleotide sugar epimerase [Chloroflexota bacterium]|nr:MAG: nucleotide sugar epimerase [Chloroflexota bacterium]